MNSVRASACVRLGFDPVTFMDTMRVRHPDWFPQDTIRGVPAVAGMLGLSQSTVRRMVNNGLLPARHINHKIIEFDRAAVEKAKTEYA